ncbi:Glycine/D-amino acid oxidase [Epibacterium ulvae]|uniref:Glycine/D-amino acid oxidase n=1 Tax=Epibacterium ulvae TaxID=1156985 RepID=A0A1G5RJB3_9RHOB|nr:FAD-dependent oxidoreductase [Epibacterium ulvae]SCZ74195.1 Glycine/D-amino acid oxidase [Epibacterium ulvae]
MALKADFAVVGAGVVGATIAFGLLKRGHSVVVLDGAQTDPRASGANFGIVWVQGKGPGVPDYQILTRTASDAWPEFARELSEFSDDKSGSLAYERNGGLTFTFGEDGFQERRNLLARLHNERGRDGDDIEMIDREEIRKLMPEFELGDEVSGASFCWRDGCVNPLRLHALLLQAIERLGGQIVWNATVQSARKDKSTGWMLTTDAGDVSSGHIVVACGLGAKELASQVGLEVPVRPQRGQVLVSQRMPKVMGLPASTLRQTADGTFLVGATKEEVEFDEGTSLAGAKQLSKNALRITPMLKHMNVVRHWAGLRVMTPDGAPIYDFGPTSSAAACHSGITLAPAHAEMFVDRVLDPSDTSPLHAFDPSRFK